MILIESLDYFKVTNLELLFLDLPSLTLFDYTQIGIVLLVSFCLSSELFHIFLYVGKRTVFRIKSISKPILIIVGKSSIESNWIYRLGGIDILLILGRKTGRSTETELLSIIIP